MFYFPNLRFKFATVQNLNSISQLNTIFFALVLVLTLEDRSGHKYTRTGTYPHLWFVWIPSLLHFLWPPLLHQHHRAVSRATPLICIVFFDLITICMSFTVVIVISRRSTTGGIVFQSCHRRWQRPWRVISAANAETATPQRARKNCKRQLHPAGAGIDEHCTSHGHGREKHVWLAWHGLWYTTRILPVVFICMIALWVV